MKKKYDIQINPRRLSGKEVARHKDFDALLKKLNGAQPRLRILHKRWLMLSGAIAAAMAGIFFVFHFMARNDYPAMAGQYFSKQQFVNPPLDQVKAQFASFKVDGQFGGVYEYPSGSKLIVPASAFVGETGNPVSGEVTLHYREMHDYVDFFLSGIPMTYDSAGTTYNLESAGMIEIFAEQDGQRVAMAPGKSIDVALVSRVNVSPELVIPPGYNIYKLDEGQRNWVYQVVDEMEALEDGDALALDEASPLYPAQKELAEKLQSIQITAEREMANIEASIPKTKEPIRPAKANNNEYVFDLDFNDLKNPAATGELAETQKELAGLYNQYEKMLWQLSPQANITPERLQKEFSEVSGLRIRKLNERDYVLTLEKGDNTISVTVNPVWSGNDYEKAMQDFNEEFAAWQQKTGEREARLAAKKQALLQNIDQLKKEAQAAFQTSIAALKAKGLDYAATEEIIKKKVVNRFRATGFGIWNCDRPLPPEQLVLAVTFKDSQGKTFENTTGYLVDKSRNTVYRFLATRDTPLSFNKNSENLLWLVTDENKLAVFRPEQFKSVAKGETAILVLETIDKKIEDESDVREVLYL
ncbi:MAG: hypothetical protein KDD27_11225 [Saprospiraceae bacterium]|nr:hypothetical protein [Saprospiraceae bacterium]